MEKRKRSKIQKWDETKGMIETDIDEIVAGSPDDVGEGPSISRNPMRSIEDMVEQNDNAFDGVINNVEQPKPVAQMTSEDVIEEEQKKKSVLKKLQESIPKPEAERKPIGCIACGDRERF